jgi:hypothetical protein
MGRVSTCGALEPACPRTKREFREAFKPFIISLQELVALAWRVPGDPKVGESAA